MNKEEAIRIVDSVKNEITSKHVLVLLNDIVFYIERQSKFTYNRLMNHIHDQRPGKLGGVYIEIDNALLFLKQELKNFKK